MTKEALLAESLRLSPEERLELLGDAWDAIAASPEEVPVPGWHVDVLEERLAAEDPAYVSWDELRERLKGSQQDAIFRIPVQPALPSNRGRYLRAGRDASSAAARILGGPQIALSGEPA